MATFINTVCYHWKRGTENTVCLFVSETMGNRHAVWLQSRNQRLHPQGFLRCTWSRSSCFSQTLILAIDSLRLLFYEVKMNGNLYLTLWLYYPPLENFCQIPGLHYLLDRNHVFSVMLLSLLQIGKGQNFVLTLVKDPASNTGLSLLKKSLISNNFSICLSSHCNL